MLKVTSPGPWPAVADLNVIQPAAPATDHWHSRAVVTFSTPVPPPDSTVELLGASVTLHRTLVGVSGVRTVEPEPHAVEKAAQNTPTIAIAETVERMSISASPDADVMPSLANVT